MMVAMEPVRPSTPDDVAFASYGLELAEAIDAALPGWIATSWTRFGLQAPLDTVVDDVRAAIVGPLRALVAADLDDQRSTPLGVIRNAVPILSEALANAGVEPLVRDEMLVRLEPDDVYGLSPASFADLGPDVAEAGLVWGAAKAHVHLQRRRRAGTDS